MTSGAGILGLAGARALAMALVLAPAVAQEDSKQQAPAVAEEDPNQMWKDTAELSYVVTAGNSETQTFGFKNKLWRAWGMNALEFSAGAVRAKSTTVTRTAFGTSSDFDVVEDEDTNLTAESYFLNGRYDRKLSEKFFWYTGAGWDRNRFAGIQNRYVAAAGVGNLWLDTERTKWRTDYSATWTKQDDVDRKPGFDDTFFGVRVTSSFMKKAGASTTYTNDTILDENADETSDFRANMINSLCVQMTTHLALKVSLQWLYDNDPAVKTIDLFDVPGPTGMKTGTVPVELDELDSIFTTSLVVNF